MKTLPRGGIRLVLCDPHPHARIGLRAIFAADSTLDIVGESGDSTALAGLIQSYQPDVVVLGALGQASVAPAVQSRPSVAVVVIVGDDADAEDWMGLVAEGVSGIVPRDAPGEELISAVRATATGRGYISPVLSDGVMRLIRTRLLPRGFSAASQPSLTAREAEVLALLCRGMANKEIASTLRLSEKTVKFHVSNLLAKSQMRTRSQLIAQSLAAGSSASSK